MASADLKAIFGLPPTEAINYLKRKGYNITFNWREMWKEAHTQSFTIAGVLKLDLLSDIRRELEKAIEQGISEQGFISELQPILERRGWWGKGLIVDEQTGEIEGKRLNPTRLETIFRTNTQTAYMAGRYQQFMENAKDRPYWLYTSVMDNRTRPDHKRFNGFVFRYDDPIWRYIWPPNGFNCRCSVRALSEDDVKRLGLTVSSSHGRIKFTEREMYEGDTIEAMYYDDPIYGKLFITDPGFDYNPGQVNYKPDLSQYPKDLVAAYKQEISHAH